MLNDLAFGIIVSILFISLVIVFCGVIIKLYIQKIKKHNASIYENQIKFQKILNTTILETQEQLLTSVSQELHDDAGQQITVINWQLENLKLVFPEYNKMFLPISESVSNLSISLREISHLLNSNWLEKNGFLEAIQSEVIRLQKNKTITIDINIEDNPAKKFSNEEQIVLFRVFQEIINNTLKHAKATQIVIEIKTNPSFEMRFCDNGIGFDYQNIKIKNTSLGLENIVRRVSIINYEAKINSFPNRGTTITILDRNRKNSVFN
jgi:signal transduction histidine kinase